MSRGLTFGLIFCTCALISCTEESEVGGRRSEVATVQTVFASNYPLAYFAERILGSSEAVAFPKIEGDPAFWEPSAGDVESMQQASVILVNGATYEKWLETVTLSERRVVDTSAPFADRYLTVENAVSHSHGPGAEHAHGGTAFTTWLDFSLAADQASAVKDALSIAGIGEPSDVDANFARLRSELEALDAALNELSDGRESPPLVASHPIYDYLARRYNLNLKSVLWEPDEPPTDIQWGGLDDLLREHPARWMIWEDEPLPEVAERLSTMGVRSIVFNPCANRPEDGDFLEVMRGNVENLRAVFEE